MTAESNCGKDGRVSRAKIREALEGKNLRTSGEVFAAVSHVRDCNFCRTRIEEDSQKEGSVYKDTLERTLYAAIKVVTT